MRLLLILAASLVVGGCGADPAWGGTHRSSSELAAFKRSSPCPSTGQRRGGCPGYVVDHVRPLCAGGADHPSNMAWQERRASLKKDAEERALCRGLKKKARTS